MRASRLETSCEGEALRDAAEAERRAGWEVKRVISRADPGTSMLILAGSPGHRPSEQPRARRLPLGESWLADCTHWLRDIRRGRAPTTSLPPAPRDERRLLAGLPKVEARRSCAGSILR